MINKKNFPFLVLGAMAMEGASFRALAKYGAMITDLKGSIGGTTFKGTAQGGSVQNKITKGSGQTASVKITKADASRLINPQANIANSAQAWRGLTSGQRAAWNAAAPDFPFRNKYGDLYTGSGFQLFMQCANNGLAIGEPILTDPPSVEAIEASPLFTIAPAGGNTLTYHADTAIPAGYVVTLYASFNMSTGRRMVPGRMKAIAFIDPASVDPFPLDAPYAAVFGTPPASGNIWFNAKITKADASRQGTSTTVNYQY